LPGARHSPLSLLACVCRKEAGLFKQLIKMYESKQSKKGLKIADQILKKNPGHGETLAMKGLIVANLGADKREEAYDLVRQGVKSDIRSHVCWHAYGCVCKHHFSLL
jgi:peptide alpha-N-acetyltransferase